ncbi:hypothetical protein BD770DRAFT_424558 [Pilaira anomala]|nr:hypothetical protein BD770DRAFT_424558 [Pilaira anomala]
MVNQADGARKVTKSGIQPYRSKIALSATGKEKKDEGCYTLDKPRVKGKEVSDENNTVDTRNTQVLQKPCAHRMARWIIYQNLRMVSPGKEMLFLLVRKNQLPRSSSIPDYDRRRLNQQLVLKDIETLADNEERTLRSIEDNISVIKADNQNMLQELNKITRRLEQLQHRQDQMQQQFLINLQDAISQIAICHFLSDIDLEIIAF